MQNIAIGASEQCPGGIDSSYLINDDQQVLPSTFDLSNTEKSQSGAIAIALISTAFLAFIIGGIVRVYR